MYPSVLACLPFFLSTVASGQGSEVKLHAKLGEAGDSILVFRNREGDPILTQVAKPEFRPFLHPIKAPDGQGQLTEFSPGHHRHQTGIYWGLTRVNGRDFFHHPEEGYWRRVDLKIIAAETSHESNAVEWQTTYEMLAEDGSPLMLETQTWTMTADENRYELTLNWRGQAKTKVQVGRYDYGGLFIRMPWKPGIQGEVLNSARHSNEMAEGQRALWLDVGMQVEGRDDLAHIAIFDHPDNKGFPQPWRVDGQWGVGPVRARLGDWQIQQGETETIQHRLVIYTGQCDDKELTKRWSDFSGQVMPPPR